MNKVQFEMILLCMVSAHASTIVGNKFWRIFGEAVLDLQQLCGCLGYSGFFVTGDGPLYALRR
jgi:hypothetical protein